MELISRARAQEKEIMQLREQIALASIRDSQLLNEKYTLEKRFSELRMALDEKQSEVITSASNELARRKGDLEVNLNLLNELKVAEDEKHIFTTSMLGILAECGAMPHVTNASALTNSIKHLHDQLQLKIRTSHARLAEVNSMIGNNSRNGFVEKEIPGDGPGIEGFQIIGDAKPGCKLLGCGFPVRGTSLCMFQWVRHYPDGTRQYIEGATNPDYIVTADDVDKLIAVECIPMDDQGRQGDIVRIFANDQNKITCDEEMQDEIDNYIAKGQAAFTVFILLDSSENWEPATLILRRSGFQVKDERKQDAVISEKFSKDLLIKIPSGLSAQFVLTCSNGSSYPFSTSNDIRKRDALVLTMRIFQSKALDEKRKGKA
ncbi:hypothetical protein MIMGU_mgv1a008436mg [Erythranthe guttata]|uniref:Uncharacterized protein n=1 Tax=Erythranthe guttata TaxID=4155 RepID=A0A022RJV6_ERYGU|nr:hypothetical protein MIMGU_mgv1a008436mg [Erythranthe guttata]